MKQIENNIEEQYKINNEIYRSEQRKKKNCSFCADKIDSLDDQIEYLNLKNRECESRLKIFQCELNESKNDTKNFKTKMFGQNQNLELLKAQLQEKTQENKILAGKLQDMRKNKLLNNKKNLESANGEEKK